MPSTGLICSQCNDVANTVTPLNGSTLLAKTLTRRNNRRSPHTM
jgi:hypothetical protein